MSWQILGAALVFIIGMIGTYIVGWQAHKEGIAKMADIDVTSKVYFGDNDGELLPLMKCVCGEKFGYWDFIIDIYRNKDLSNNCCPKCGRRFYFSNKITIYEVVDG